MAIIGEDAFHINILDDSSKNLQAIELLNGLNISERVLIRNKYPVQDLLSLMLNCEVEVLPIYQSEQNGVIMRWVQLISGTQVLCYANSVIPFSPDIINDIPTPINPRGFITGIREQKFGIGQLIDAIELKTKRSLKSIYVNEDFISRIYEITSATDGIELNLTINETFPRSIFKL